MCATKIARGLLARTRFQAVLVPNGDAMSQPGERANQRPQSAGPSTALGQIGDRDKADGERLGMHPYLSEAGDNFAGTVNNNLNKVVPRLRAAKGGQYQ